MINRSKENNTSLRIYERTKQSHQSSRKNDLKQHSSKRKEQSKWTNFHLFEKIE